MSPKKPIQLPPPTYSKEQQKHAKSEEMLGAALSAIHAAAKLKRAVVGAQLRIVLKSGDGSGSKSRPLTMSRCKTKLVEWEPKQPRVIDDHDLFARGAETRSKSVRLQDGDEALSTHRSRASISEQSPRTRVRQAECSVSDKDAEPTTSNACVLVSDQVAGPSTTNAFASKHMAEAKFSASSAGPGANKQRREAPSKTISSPPALKTKLFAKYSHHSKLSKSDVAVKSEVPCEDVAVNEMGTEFRSDTACGAMTKHEQRNEVTMDGSTSVSETPKFSSVSESPKIPADTTKSKQNADRLARGTERGDSEAECGAIDRWGVKTPNTPDGSRPQSRSQANADAAFCTTTNRKSIPRDSTNKKKKNKKKAAEDGGRGIGKWPGGEMEDDEGQVQDVLVAAEQEWQGSQGKRQTEKELVLQELEQLARDKEQAFQQLSPSEAGKPGRRKPGRSSPAGGREGSFIKARGGEGASGNQRKTLQVPSLERTVLPPGSGGRRSRRERVRKASVFEEMAAAAGIGEAKALTVTSALQELYCLHSANAAAEREKINMLHRAARRAHIPEPSSPSSPLPQAGAKSRDTGDAGGEWKSKMQQLQVKMSTVTFPYNLLVYQPVGDKVTLLSVCGSSVSEVASCPYTQVEVTYGSSGNGVSEGSVLLRIPEVTALPPSVLFPVSVWTRIASERRKKLLQVSTHASNIAFKSSAIKRQLVGLSRPHDGESQHASPDGKMSPEPYIVSPVSATGGKAHVHSPNIYPALGDSPSIQPRHSEDVANDGRPPDRAAPGQPQAALSLSPREKHPQGLPMDAVQPSVGARKTRKVATRQALSFSRPAKEGQAQLARMSPVSGCAGGESVGLKEWEHDAHVEGLRQLRNYVGFVVPGLSENTSLNVEEIGLRADVAVGGIGMPGAAEGERGGMEDERKKKLLSFNEVVELCQSLFLEDNCEPPGVVDHQASAESDDHTDDDVGGESFFLTGVSEIQPKEEKKRDSLFEYRSAWDNSAEAPLEQFWNWLKLSELNLIEGTTAPVAQFEFDGLKQLARLPNPEGSHRPELRGGAAASRVLLTVLPEVRGVLSGVHKKNLADLHHQDYLRRFSRAKAKRQHLSNMSRARGLKQADAARYRASEGGSATGMVEAPRIDASFAHKPPGTRWERGETIAGRIRNGLCPSLEGAKRGEENRSGRQRWVSKQGHPGAAGRDGSGEMVSLVLGGNTVGTGGNTKAELEGMSRQDLIDMEREVALVLASRSSDTGHQNEEAWRSAAREAEEGGSLTKTQISLAELDAFVQREESRGSHGGRLGSTEVRRIRSGVRGGSRCSERIKSSDSHPDRFGQEPPAPVTLIPWEEGEMTSPEYPRPCGLP